MNESNNLYINQTKNNNTNDLFFKNEKNKNDEIHIDGNLPLINIDVAKDIIVLSRERKEFIDILLKNKTNNKWEEYTINTYISNKNNENKNNKSNNISNNNNESINSNYYNNSEITYYNRINSFKILQDDNNKLSILELYISIKSKGIFANSIIFDFNKKKFTSDLHTLFSYRLDKKSDELKKNISYIYDIKSSLIQLQDDYFHNSIFSKNNLNNNNKILNFEFFHRRIVSLNITSLELVKIATLSSGIESIQSDSNNNNLISIDSKKYIYYFYRRDDEDVYEDYISINLNNIPNKYRKSEILASYIETFGKDKTRLFLLLNKGVIVSLDFGKIIKKMNRNIITVLISDYFYSIFMMVFNLVILIIVLKRRKQKRQRNNDIRNVINNLGNLRRE